jgi:hypothetical protein
LHEYARNLQSTWQSKEDILQILFQSRAQIRVTPGQMETPFPPKKVIRNLEK